MNLLPKKFKSWNRFLKSIESTHGFNPLIDKVIYEGVEFSLIGIKLTAFEEIRNILPEKEVIIDTLFESRKAINMNSFIKEEELVWLSKLISVL